MELGFSSSVSLVKGQTREKSAHWNRDQGTASLSTLALGGKIGPLGTCCRAALSWVRIHTTCRILEPSGQEGHKKVVQGWGTLGGVWQKPIALTTETLQPTAKASSE